MNELYKKQVTLLIRIMPSVYRIQDFAVHGELLICLKINRLNFIVFNFRALFIPRKPSEINALLYIENLRPLLRPCNLKKKADQSLLFIMVGRKESNLANYDYFLQCICLIL